MQSEIKDLDSKLNLSPSTYGEGKTYLDVLEGGKNQHQGKTKKLQEKKKERPELRISPRRPTSPGSPASPKSPALSQRSRGAHESRGPQGYSPSFKLSPRAVGESARRVTKRALGQGDPWETQDSNQGGILIQDQAFSDAGGDLAAVAGSGLSPGEQAYPGIPEEDATQQDSTEARSPKKKKARTEAVQMLSLAKRRRLAKSEMKAQKMAERGLRADEYESSEEEEPDTLEAAKKRARIALFGKLKDMDSVRRREFLQERACTQAATTTEDDAKEENMLLFFSLISKNEAYPVETINKLLIEQVKQFEVVNKSTFSDSQMVSKFAQNDLINGLCMLKCLKDEEMHKHLLQEYEMLESSSKQILGAVQTIKNFQKERAHEDPDLAGVDFAELLGIREREEDYSELTDN